MNKKQHPYYPFTVVSECGRIFSTVHGKEKELRPWKSGHGYLLVGINLGHKKNVQRSVHRLVAETFLENLDNLREVDHIDCNKTNNHVSNLDWVTSKENKRRAWENGLYTDKGEDHHGATLTEETVRAVCQALQDGMRNKEVSELFGIHKDHIAHIKRGSIWAEVSSEYNLQVPRKERKSLETVHKICLLISEGLSNRDIKEKYNISQQDLSRIRRKEIFKVISDSYF